jgi:hypothetical protein
VTKELTKFQSPLAHQYEKQKLWRKRTDIIYGLAIHTMGTDPWDVARKHKVDPFEWVVSYYARPDSYGPTYAMDRKGTLIQISSEDEKAQHIGLTAKQRNAYLSGDWERKNPIDSKRWRTRWPTAASPSHLYPGPSPNNVYIGVELLPDPEYGCYFTDEQYHGVSMLWADIRDRHKLPDTITRLVGHEDINPMDRFDEGGGWDPGGLRDKPSFDWKKVVRL